METTLSDYQFAIVTAFFIMMLSCSIAGIVAFNQPKFIESATNMYSKSVVNTTYSSVSEQVKQNIIPAWIGVCLFIIVILLNNLFIATIIVFIPRYVGGWLGYFSITYLLASVSFIPGMLFARVAIMVGTGYAIAAFLPHGIFEFAGVSIGGGIGYYYLMKKGINPELELKQFVKSSYVKYVVPLILIASIIEVTVTPVIMYIMLY